MLSLAASEQEDYVEQDSAHVANGASPYWRIRVRGPWLKPAPWPWKERRLGMVTVEGKGFSLTACEIATAVAVLTRHQPDDTWSSKPSIGPYSVTANRVPAEDIQRCVKELEARLTQCNENEEAA